MKARPRNPAGASHTAPFRGRRPDGALAQPPEGAAVAPLQGQASSFRRETDDSMALCLQWEEHTGAGAKGLKQGRPQLAIIPNDPLGGT